MILPPYRAIVTVKRENDNRDNLMCKHFAAAPWLLQHEKEEEEKRRMLFEGCLGIRLIVFLLHHISSDTAA